MDGQDFNERLWDLVEEARAAGLGDEEIAAEMAEVAEAAGRGE